MEDIPDKKLIEDYNNKSCIKGTAYEFRFKHFTHLSLVVFACSQYI